jgi:hypothetical protein
MLGLCDARTRQAEFGSVVKAKKEHVRYWELSAIAPCVWSLPLVSGNFNVTRLSQPKILAQDEL